MMAALWQLLVSFGQIGLFAMGGGNSMLKLIQDECVNNRRWITLEEYGALVGASYLFPGLTVIKTVGMIGLKVAGVPGLILSVAAVTLPGLVLAALFYSLVAAQKDNPQVKKLLVLMQYGALALFAAALYAMARPMVKDVSYPAAGLAVAMFIGVAFFDLSPFLALVLLIGVGMMVL